MHYANKINYDISNTTERQMITYNTGKIQIPLGYLPAQTYYRV